MASVVGYSIEEMKDIQKFWTEPSVKPSKPLLVESKTVTPENTSDVEEVSTSITQTWTEQSIKCYLTNADCENCSIPRGQYSFTCQMTKVVPVLLKTLGQPDKNRVNKLLPYLPQY